MSQRPSFRYFGLVAEFAEDGASERATGISFGDAGGFSDVINGLPRPQALVVVAGFFSVGAGDQSPIEALDTSMVPQAEIFLSVFGDWTFSALFCTTGAGDATFFGDSGATIFFGLATFGEVTVTGAGGALTGVAVAGVVVGAGALRTGDDGAAVFSTGFGAEC